MSKTVRKRQEPSISIPKEVGRPTLTQPQQELTKEQKRLNDLLKQLMELCTHAVIKVATCNCRDKDKCDVYNKAKDIATIIDEVTELRGETEVASP